VMKGTKSFGLFILLTFSRFSSDDLIELSQIIIANCILGILYTSLHIVLPASVKQILDINL
jgi:hypothetical protein